MTMGRTSWIWPSWWPWRRGSSRPKRDETLSPQREAGPALLWGTLPLGVEIHGTDRVRWSGNVTDIEARAIVTVPSFGRFPYDYYLP
jgi:hypothetical protein